MSKWPMVFSQVDQDGQKSLVQMTNGLSQVEHLVKMANDP
jgi:hypothetical protein